MSRNKKRKMNRNSWQKENMEEAIAAIKDRKLGFKAAAKRFNVPRTTLRWRVLDQNKKAKGSCQQLGRFQPTFTE